MRGPLSASLAVALGLFMPGPVMSSEFRALDQVPFPVTGYRGPLAIGIRELRAPLDPDGSDPFLGSRFLPANHTANPEQCTTSCDTITGYNKAHPAADGSYTSCNLVISYLVSNNGVFEGIQCDLYTHEFVLPSLTLGDGNTIGYAYVRDPSLFTTPTVSVKIMGTITITISSTTTITSPSITTR
ncbi:hypothetical protein B0H65DRAFT_448290 [Neurospora tetraspora]|uniref:Uncharacterized protein n=1 Tax=Neurospora tetraspora TaxID=94610 RepID=A0AAE0MVG1_9PEZI|nr:hypothetical protein B0H65DRAFT_448290 [Neurospora tetraspora]